MYHYTNSNSNNCCVSARPFSQGGALGALIGMQRTIASSKVKYTHVYVYVYAYIYIYIYNYIHIYIYIYTSAIKARTPRGGDVEDTFICMISCVCCYYYYY